MLVAIRIWTKLKRSIPAGFKDYYSLITDPTAGKVTVVARVPTLEVPILFTCTLHELRVAIMLARRPQKNEDQSKGDNDKRSEKGDPTRENKHTAFAHVKSA